MKRSVAVPELPAPGRPLLAVETPAATPPNAPYAMAAACLTTYALQFPSKIKLKTDISQSVLLSNPTVGFEIAQNPKCKRKHHLENNKA
jgi:hypothetical protein